MTIEVYEATLTAWKGIAFLLAGTLSFIILFIVLRFAAHKCKDDEAVVDTEHWGSFEELEIIKIIEETDTIKSFRLKRPENKTMPAFYAGQFLSVQIGNSEDKVFRSYSISSSAINLDCLDISIKLLDGGVGSSWFHSRGVGDNIIAYPPNGLFTPSTNDKVAKPLVLIAAGIGITPILSIVRTEIDKATTRAITLFYASRTEKDLAFYDLLKHYEKWHDNFKLIPILSQEGDSWTGLKGRLSIDIIKENVGDLQASTYYMCGPEALSDALTDALLKEGLDEDDIHSEKFASPADMDESQFEERDVKVKANGEELEYIGRRNLLDFLESKEVAIDFACRSGVCGNCKAKLVSGDVHSFTEDGLTREEKKAGYILCCVSRPETDIELDIPSY